MASVQKQDFRDFEYIIVDDGSKDNPDAVVMPFLNQADFPVMYIKKENGGVHTARNMAIKQARGKLLVNIDSDDEMPSSALTKFKNAWEMIPQAERNKYREVVGRCMDQNGKEVGARFPENINQLPWKEALAACEATNGEHHAAMVTKILQDNQFPEIDGVTFVTENILWVKLYQNYKSWFINDIVRIYHSDGDDHLSTDLVHPKKTIQTCRNAMFGSSYMLNHWDIYKDFISYRVEMLRYCIMHYILKRHQDKYADAWNLERTQDKAVAKLIALPAWLLSYVYESKRM